MKAKFLFAALFAASTVLTSCDKDDDKKPATQQPQETPGMNAKVNNADWKAATSTAMFQNNMLVVNGTTSTGQALSVTVPGGNKVGEFKSSSTPGVVGMYSETNGSTSHSWMSPMTGGNTTVNITKYDATAKKVSGSFTFTADAVQGSGATGSKSVTNGTFTDVAIQ